MAGYRSITMWEQLGEHYIQTDGPPGKWVKAKCRHCNWQQSANSARMRRHWFEAHALAGQSQSSASSQSSHSGASAHPMASEKDGRHFIQQTLQMWTDCAFSAEKQRTAEMCLALLKSAAAWHTMSSSTPACLPSAEV